MLSSLITSCLFDEFPLPHLQKQVFSDNCFPSFENVQGLSGGQLPLDRIHDGQFRTLAPVASDEVAVVSQFSAHL